jgi:hypothetical protein
VRLVFACLLVLALTPAAARAESMEVFSPDGTISRMDVPARVSPPVAPAVAARLAASKLVPLQDSGPPQDRIDLVILGDGYTADEQGLFREHALAKWQQIAKTEPFTDYASYFNVWLVEVVSNESGVDNDPRPPTMRDTALDMGFYCQGTERALCVDEAKATAAAKAAPAADQILVLANSTKYGGVGGTVATSSGGNVAAGLITVHELGHSLGGLADEYDYYYRAGTAEDSTQDVTIPAPYLFYPGALLGEPDGVNITATADAADLVAAKTKWWRWVGEPSPDGGVVGTFEGGGYYRYGMYRPSEDSLMHSLGIAEGGNPFNPPSAEAMVDAFYRKVKPIASTARDGAVLKVEPMQPATHDLEIRWSVDGVEQPAARGQRAFTAAAGARKVDVTVSDPTPLVRDPDAIAKRLTQKYSWTI